MLLENHLAGCRPVKGGVLAALSALILLSGCASPAPQMIGAAERRVTRGAHDYVLYRRGTRVEVIRLGYAPKATREGIRLVMARLMAEETGCRVVTGSLHGDSGEMRGRLACPLHAPYPFAPAASAPGGG